MSLTSKESSKKYSPISKSDRNTEEDILENTEPYLLQLKYTNPASIMNVIGKSACFLHISIGAKNNTLPL